jgi:hypothetical protein
MLTSSVEHIIFNPNTAFQRNVGTNGLSMSHATLVSRNIENATDLETVIAGWVPSGKDRGTIDILWNSCITIILCCWVSAYPNVPPPKAKWYRGFLDKVWVALVGLLGPDFLFAIAYGQLSSAKRSVQVTCPFEACLGLVQLLTYYCDQMFRNSPELCSGMKWTYTHGFFLDMGGIHLTSPDYPDGFPINAEQLYYLVQHEHVEFPDMEKMDISERNSQDTLSRSVFEMLAP